jgi:hypothetical protein
MQRRTIASFLGVASLAAAAWAAGTGASTPPTRSGETSAEWQMNATIIEACSCPMFCQCYFNAEPADHSGCCKQDVGAGAPAHFCKFNNAFQVNKGTYGTVKLDGAKFWVAGDLGGDFSKGKMAWAVLHFDPAVTKEQREGIQAVLGALYPVEWGSFEVKNDFPIDWKGGKDRSVAKLDGGKAAEVVLVKNKGMTDEPIVIKNLKYWGAPRNDGFILMANEVEAYRTGAKPYEFKGTNGFMITVDIASSDPQVKDASAKKGY